MKSVFSSFIKFSTAKKHNHEADFFGGKNGSCCSISFHMKMTPYVVVHSPHNWGFGQFMPKWEVLQIKWAISGLQAFVMEKKHSNESSGKGKKCFCEPILAVRITVETFQCHRWENNLFSLQLKAWCRKKLISSKNQKSDDVISLGPYCVVCVNDSKRLNRFHGHQFAPLSWQCKRV